MTVKEKAEKILEDYIFNQTHIGSGDDGMYFQECNDYVNKQKPFLIGYGVKVIQERNKEVKEEIETFRKSFIKIGNIMKHNLERLKIQDLKDDKYTTGYLMALETVIEEIENLKKRLDLK